MSDAQPPHNAPVADALVTDPTTATTITTDASPAEPVVDGEAPATDPATAVVSDAVIAEVTTEPAEKAVEPIAEGQLAYKGPGLLKSIIPSKKELWLAEEAVPPQSLDLYLRGEKPEISHAVVAWASQTGKGLLFLNKKGDNNRAHPADVLALYDATDLKKSTQHEFSFKLNGETHTFKAASDAERDGWYLSMERAIEHGKAAREEIRASDGYKAELEKLNKPNVVGAATTRSLSMPKKSSDAPATDRIGSSDGEVEADKKHHKARSTSRGILNRFKSNKEEVEQKPTEEKAVEKEEAPVLATTEAAPVIAAASTAGVPAEAAAVETPVETPVEEKTKANKRGSIFGRVSSGWSGLRSPAKEKDAKDAELKLDASAAAPVSENPPVLPETASTTDSAAGAAIPAVEEPAVEPKADEKKEEVATPNKEKNNFLSGFGGFIKRNRSVSPNTNKEPVKPEDVPAVPSAEQTPVVESAGKAEEPTAQGAAAVAEPSSETSADKAEEPKPGVVTPNKRQSVLGSLGRRASKALNRIQAPKKENVASAATEAPDTEPAVAKPAEESAVVGDGETKAEEPKA